MSVTVSVTLNVTVSETVSETVSVMINAIAHIMCSSSHAHLFCVLTLGFSRKRETARNPGNVVKR